MLSILQEEKNLTVDRVANMLSTLSLKLEFDKKKMVLNKQIYFIETISLSWSSVVILKALVELYL